MLGNMDMQKLLKARQMLLSLKDEKLALKAPQHLNDPLNFYALNYHLLSEVDEFQTAAHTAFPYPDVKQLAMLLELADISSMCDVIAMQIIEGKVNVF